MNKSINSIRKRLEKSGIQNISVSEKSKSVRLDGFVDEYNAKLSAGFIAFNGGYKGVINDIECKNIPQENITKPHIYDNMLDGKYYDAVIIGGGVIGISIARELAKYSVSIAVLEKEADICKHASSRNDGMIHPGFAASPGTKKAYYNVRGNRLYTKLCEELQVPFKRVGSLILYTHPLSKLLTPILIHRAKTNAVDGYHYLNRNAVKRREPYISDEQHGGFLLPSAGILSPYGLTLALAENAVNNGCDIHLNTIVNGFDIKHSHINIVKTNRGNIRAGVIVNACGIWSDKVAELAGDRFFTIHPRKGVDAILDKRTGEYQQTIAALVRFTQMKSKTKGGGIVPTIEGNLLVGPTACEVPYREDYSVDKQSLDMLLEKMKVNKRIGKEDIITFFAGTRACTYSEDFIIEKSEYIDNLIHTAGIQSPGLASAPAIAEDVSTMCVEILKQTKDIRINDKFNPYRKGKTDFSKISLEKRCELIKLNPKYGNIVCRCEEVSEGEVRDAFKSTVPPVTVDGVKRRTRAGMGRCHGGFCLSRIMEIISEETKIPMTEITKKGKGSEILTGETKEDC